MAGRAVELNLQQQTTPRATTDQDIQQAARSLRDQIRENVRAQLEAERARAAGHAVPTPPTPPAPEAIVTVPSGMGFPPASDFPPELVDVSIAFFIMVAAIIIGLPLARAFARRMDRRGAAPQISNEVSAQLNQISQAVDAIALEVERISEGQRFTTKLLTESETNRHTLPR
ncbi:MAG TPA: hypothetical protein VGO75_06065 [Gemmatimonadaceae bacterium]|nr:hypothetical protein [Gemmatimonadaceae bacterium]